MTEMKKARLAGLAFLRIIQNSLMRYSYGNMDYIIVSLI